MFITSLCQESLFIKLIIASIYGKYIGIAIYQDRSDPPITSNFDLSLESGWVVLFSTINLCYFVGHKSHVFPRSGSVLVTEFCEVVKRECQYKEMTDLLLKVKKQRQIIYLQKCT